METSYSRFGRNTEGVRTSDSPRSVEVSSTVGRSPAPLSEVAGDSDRSRTPATRDPPRTPPGVPAAGPPDHIRGAVRRLRSGQLRGVGLEPPALGWIRRSGRSYGWVVRTVISTQFLTYNIISTDTHFIRICMLC